jgi:1-acyl-sn-glycerol-3-phosphate acyltransferase
MRAARDYALLAIGGLLLALACFAWALAALLLYPLLPAATGRRLGRRVATRAFRAWLETMQALGAWRLDLAALDGIAAQGPLIVAPNHPSLLDALLLVSRLPDACCVMKGSLAASFLLGPAARLARYLRNGSLRCLLSGADEELRRGGQLVVFPEGTRSAGAGVGAFTEAVGALSRRTGVAVQTVVIESDSAFLGKGWSALARPPLPLAFRVRLGRRFEPPGDVRAFTAALERYFQQELALRPMRPVDEACDDGPVTQSPQLRG